MDAPGRSSCPQLQAANEIDSTVKSHAVSLLGPLLVTTKMKPQVPGAFLDRPGTVSMLTKLGLHNELTKLRRYIPNRSGVT